MYSKEETAIRKTVSDGLKSLLTYTSKHVDTNLVDIIRGNKSSSGGTEISKYNLKSIQSDSQRRIDVYTKLTNECLLKRDPALFTVATAATTASAAAVHANLSRNKFTAYTIRALSEESTLRDLARLISGYVKYCDLLTSGADVYAEPSDEDEDEAVRKKQRAAMSSEDRNRAVLSRMMCVEGRLLTGLAAAVLFVNRSVKHLERDLSAVLAQAATVAAEGPGGKQGSAHKRTPSESTGQPKKDGSTAEVEEDILYKTITLTVSNRATVSAIAGVFVRAFPNADSLVGLLECSSDPATQLTTLRIINALAESDPIATIPFIAAVENSIATIGQFVNPERTANHCGSASNMLLKIQSSAVALLCQLTDPVAIDAAQKADAANSATAANTDGNGDTVQSGAEGAFGDDDASPASTVAWAGMSGALQRVIQGALVFDDCLKHLFALAETQRGALAKDEIAAEISETVAKTALAVPLIGVGQQSGGGVGSSGDGGSFVVDGQAVRSPHPSVARSDGSLALVRRIATVISNVLVGNAQTTKTFLQMGYLEQAAMFFRVPPPFAAQCGDEDLAPLPVFARNRATRSASLVPELGVEQLLPTACDIILHCLETAARDQARLAFTSPAPAGGGGGESREASTDYAVDDENEDYFEEAASGGRGAPCSPSAQMCLDQLLHRSTTMKSVLHWTSLIGSCAAKGDMLQVTSGGIRVFRQLTRVLFLTSSLVAGQTRTCVEWLIRNDLVSVKAAISADHCTGYFAAAILPTSPAAMAMAITAATSEADGKASFSSAPQGRTAIAAIVEDVCLRIPPRDDPSTAVSFVSLLLNYSLTVPFSISSLSLSSGAAIAATSIADFVALTLLTAVKQPNASPQALGIRQIATALLPRLADGQRQNGAYHQPSSLSSPSPSATTTDPSRSYGSSGRTMIIVGLMNFVGDAFLPSLLAIPEPLPSSSRGGGAFASAPKSSAFSPSTSQSVTPRTTPRGSIAIDGPIGLMQQQQQQRLPFHPASGAAAALFCIALLDAVAALEGFSDGGCGLNKSALGMLETAVVSKAAALARAAFESDEAVSTSAAVLSGGVGVKRSGVLPILDSAASPSPPTPPPTAQSSALSPSMLSRSSGDATSATVLGSVSTHNKKVSPKTIVDRLLAWLVLAILQHVEVAGGGSAEAKVKRCLRDILSGIKAITMKNKNITREEDEREGGEGRSDAADTIDNSDVDDNYDEGADSADPLGMLIDTLCGPYSGVRKLLSSSSSSASASGEGGGRGESSSGVDLGMSQFATVLSASVRALFRTYGRPPRGSLPSSAAAMQELTVASIPGRSSPGGGSSLSSLFSPVSANDSPFSGVCRLIRLMCSGNAPPSAVGLATANVAVAGGKGRNRGSVSGRSAATANYTNFTAPPSVGGGPYLSLSGASSPSLSSSAIGFLVMRDVVIRYVQQTRVDSEGDQSEADESDHGHGHAATKVDGNIKEGDAHQKGKSSSAERLSTENSLRKLAEEAVILLQRRRKRIDMMFPLFDDDDDNDGDHHDPNSIVKGDALIDIR